ncbi:MAG: hypothetical protein ABR567_18550, partial [Myxococcales bacterium]
MFLQHLRWQVTTRRASGQANETKGNSKKAKDDAAAVTVEGSREAASDCFCERENKRERENEKEKESEKEKEQETKGLGALAPALRAVTVAALKSLLLKCATPYAIRAKE